MVNELRIEPNGNIRSIYSEALTLSVFGALEIKRASHVEPDSSGRWIADLSPVQGPTLGPFDCRSEALAAEHNWLLANWI